MRLTISISLLVLLSFLPCAAAQPQSVHLHANLEPGWSSRYKLVSRLELRSGDEVGELLVQTITLRLAVVASEEADGDGPRAATLRATIERLDIRHTSSGDTVQVIIPAPERQPAHDASPHLERIYLALSEAVLEFEVLPTGRARLISGLDTALSAAEAAEPRNPARFLGILAPGAVERTIGAIVTLDPHRLPRSEGDTWRDEQTVPVVGREAQVLADYTLRAILHAAAEVHGTTTVSLQPGDAAPTQPHLAIPEQSGALRARWDTQAGRLIERTSDTRIVWQATLRADPPIESRTTALSHLAITLQPEPAQPR